MIIIDTHKVLKCNQSIRLVDYVIGVFPQLMTKNAVKKALKRKELLLNNTLATSGHWMIEGDVISHVDTESRIPKVFPLEIEIVFEDDYFLIANKPSGLTVSGNSFRTLENAMVDQFNLSSQKDALKWVKPVHRIDNATSGLVILSKTASFHREMAKLFEKRQVNKIYHAITVGDWLNENGVIDLSINHQVAETHFTVIQKVSSLKSGMLSLLILKPKTGRTHQLRVHCATINHPIVGDVIYGEKGNVLLHKGLFLAATSLSFVHPILKTNISIEIPIPYKFVSLLERENRRWKKFDND